MKQLSGLDATFLYLETAEMPMHVGALHMFELPAGYRGNFVADVRKHMAARLPLAPALRPQAGWMPLNLANPAWVDAEPDLEEHIVEIKLPRRPAATAWPSWRRRSAELHPVLLDRNRPLWKFHVFDGLAPRPNGEQARRRSTRSCTTRRSTARRRWRWPRPSSTCSARAARDRGAAVARAARRQLGMTEMLRGALANQLRAGADLVKALPPPRSARSSQVAAQTAARAIGEAAAVLRACKGEGAKALEERQQPRPRAAHAAERDGLRHARLRHASACRWPSSSCCAGAIDATLNDVVLWSAAARCAATSPSTAPLPRKSLVAAVPISLRAKGDTSANNQASMSLISLGTHLADPAQAPGARDGGHARR